MKSNQPRFWTPRTGGLLTLLGLAVVTVVATLFGESLIGRNSAPQTALPGPKLTIAPMFKGLQANSRVNSPVHSVRHTLQAAHLHPPAIAVLVPVSSAAPVAPVVTAPPAVAMVQRPLPAPEIAQPQQPSPARVPKHRPHKHSAPVAVAQITAIHNAPVPTQRPLPPRALVPVTTMTAPPPASIQLRPVETVTAEPPASNQLVPVQTVTAAPPRT